MNEPELKDWLRKEQPTIEKIILEAANAYVQKFEKLPNFGHDLSISQQEAYNLMGGEDLCYDRFTTPLAYSLWYQARRINIFLSHFINKIIEACNSGYPIEIFDLGAGTGCVQFSLGLCYVAYARKKLSPSFFRIINIDLSPFMLEYLRSFLWPTALKYYPELKQLPVEYQVYSWSNRADLKVMNPWICASYLFDSSDNEDYLTTNFEELIKAFEPAKVMFLTSSQRNKLSLMNSLASKMKTFGYQVIPSNVSGHIFEGNLSEVDKLRKSLISKYGLQASQYSVSWKDKSFTSVGLEKIQTGLGFDTRLKPQHLDIFNPPLKIRRDVQLNDLQKKAAAFETTPSIITGPAGCGKSVVITEKIITILQQYRWSKNLHILITTFNKGLVKQLRQWVSDLLDANNKQYRQVYYHTRNNIDDGTGEIILSGQFNIKIKFVHFEMLGKHIGRINYTGFNEQNHITHIKSIILGVKELLKIAQDEMNDILNPEFLLEEYHRVIYGLNCKLADGEELYQTIERKGRGNKPRLERNSQRRKAIWLTLWNYAKWMHTNPRAGQSFIARRQLFLNQLSSNEFVNHFDYVFVDEFQDCTPADYKIMSLMLKDVNNLILAGDLAQAVHVGQSGTIPRDEQMNRRKYHKLTGSYRLPFRICEAIFPLSHEISVNSGDQEVTVELTPYKGSPPGARPIIIYGENDIALSEKIISIKNIYHLFDLQKITILEKDESLRKSLENNGQKVETTTILRLKGLEKEFIVWSLQADILYENEIKEFAYTIMTRTNCLLVIAITPLRKQYNIDLLKYLRQDRLIIWDANTMQYLHNIFL